jgi:hypothetical protein
MHHSGSRNQFGVSCQLQATAALLPGERVLSNRLIVGSMSSRAGLDAVE